MVKKLVNVFDKILESNRKEFPFCLDMGHIMKIRLSKFTKEQERIQNSLLDVDQFYSKDTLFKQINDILKEHPDFMHNENFLTFENIATKLIVKISQMEFFIPELSRFIEEGLMDDSYSILDQSEKQILLDTYVEPLNQMTRDVLLMFKEYETVVNTFIANLVDLRENISLNPTEYKEVSAKSKSRSKAVAVDILASGIVGFAVRGVVIKVLAGFLIGGRSHWSRSNNLHICTGETKMGSS